MPIGVLSSYVEKDLPRDFNHLYKEMSIKADYVNNAYRPKQSNIKGRNYAKDNDIKHTYDSHVRYFYSSI